MINFFDYSNVDVNGSQLSHFSVITESRLSNQLLFSKVELEKSQPSTTVNIKFTTSIMYTISICSHSAPIPILIKLQVLKLGPSQH